MRLDGALVGYQTHIYAEPKAKNENIFDCDGKTVTVATDKQTIRVTDLVSQRQLLDKLHTKAKVVISFITTMSNNIILFY